MTALISVTAHADPATTTTIADRLTVELGLPAGVAALIADRATDRRGTVVFQGNARCAADVAARARRAGMKVRELHVGEIEDHPDIEVVHLPRRRGRH